MKNENIEKELIQDYNFHMFSIVLFSIYILSICYMNFEFALVDLETGENRYYFGRIMSSGLVFLLLCGVGNALHGILTLHKKK